MDSWAAAETKGPSVLFVCTANICRSPMAAALFQDRLRQERPDWQSWHVDSAGTWGLDGEASARYSQAAMTRRGLNISSHRAKTVTAEMLAKYDLILTMEPGQKEAIQIEFPEVAERVYVLSEMAGQARPINDPYGGEAAGYEKAAEEIDQLLAIGMPRILWLVTKKHSR